MTEDTPRCPVCGQLEPVGPNLLENERLVAGVVWRHLGILSPFALEEWFQALRAQQTKIEEDDAGDAWKRG